MKIPEFPKFKDKYHSAGSYLILPLVSVLALVATFLVSNLSLLFELKTAIFLSITFSYLAFCLLLYIREAKTNQNAAAGIYTEETEEKLLALEEASMFFGASLKPSEMFRLVASRINELIPFASCVLFLPDADNAHLCAAQAVGEKAEKFDGLRLASNESLAWKTFLSGEIRTAGNLLFEKDFIAPEILETLKSAVSVPLRNEAEVFGVLMLYANREKAFDKKSVELIEAVGARISPLFLSSIAFERNLENALTDNLTSLPNERAFYLVLENQIAESQRFREQRPLAVLSIDIQNFDEINKRFGHARGDQILSYAAKMIKGQLRQMDFLSRSTGDEFLAVLPTASEEITEIIINRIGKAFALSPFELTKSEREFIKLNFGCASFLKDGETAPELLRAANLKKQQAKKSGKSSILWFPREYVN
ncbi:MAG TPA: sensor domain-containing diguanylate cyclase [Pyrinomonadaceae bacterium]|nr:sensor domain-containing diguanylate cyclase [Pyrinomonadaceae bacterium]